MIPTEKHSQLFVNYEGQITDILKNIGEGSWSRIPLITPNSAITQYLNPGYQGLEVGSWNSQWTKPTSLQDLEVVRITVGESDDGSKADRVQKLASILQDAGVKLEYDARKYLVVDRFSLANGLAILEQKF